MKVFSIILIVIGIVAAASAGAVAMRQMARDRTHRAETARLEDEREKSVEERTQHNLTQRAVLKSIHNQPDSLRMAKSGEISMRIRELDKRIRVLSMKEKELSRLMRREKRHSAEEWVEARRKMIPLGTGGIVFLVTGGLLAWKGRQRA
jgi:hypothetical protein